MKVLIVVACALAVASAGYVGHYKAHHIPILDHNGYQLDTPEVSHAKAVHFAAHAEAKARNGHGLYGGHAVAVAPLGYAGHYHGHYLPAFDHNGYQLDEPAVAHAKAVHFAAHADARARSYAHGYPFIHYRKRRGILAAPIAYTHGYYHGPQHIPIIGPHGVPLDTPEVIAARAHHAHSHAEASARNGDYHLTPIAYGGHSIAPVYAGHYGHYAGQHLPVIAHNGVPLDEPAVVHAKAAHAVAHAEARARNGDYLHHY